MFLIVFIQGLKSIREAWEKIELEMVPHKDTGIYRLLAVDDIFQTLEENQVLLSAMKSTRLVLHNVDMFSM